MSLSWQQQTVVLHLQHLAADQMVLAGSGALAAHGMITRTPNDLDYMTEMDGDTLLLFAKRLNSALTRDGYALSVLTHPTATDSVMLLGAGPENEMLRVKLLNGRVMPGLRVETPHGLAFAPLVAHMGKLQALATLPRATHARDVHELAHWAGGWQPMLEPFHHMVRGMGGDAPLVALHEAFARVPFYDDRRFDLPAEQVREIKREYIEQARSLADILSLDAERTSRQALEAALLLDLTCERDQPPFDRYVDLGPDQGDR